MLTHNCIIMYTCIHVTEAQELSQVPPNLAVAALPLLIDSPYALVWCLSLAGYSVRCLDAACHEKPGAIVAAYNQGALAAVSAVLVKHAAARAMFVDCIEALRSIVGHAEVTPRLIQEGHLQQLVTHLSKAAVAHHEAR